MIAAFVRKNLQATIERLNRREIFSCEFYQARNMDAAKKSVEDGGSFSHIIFDIAYFDGDIDAGLELLSRFSATTTAIMIVVNDDVNFGLAVKQGTCNLRGDGGYATLTLKTGEHISTFRLTESQLLSNGLASLSSSIQEFHPTPYDRLQGTQLAFYYVDPQYISSLSAAEIQVHGISHIPHVIYDGRHTKFMCGAVLHIPHAPYMYVAPVSSTQANGIGDIPIMMHSGSQALRKGTLRLRYMFPALPEVLAHVDIAHVTSASYRNLLNTQLDYLRSIHPQIASVAADMHELVCAECGSNRFIDRCCDFPLLEQACRDYGIRHELESVCAPQIVPPIPPIDLVP